MSRREPSVSTRANGSKPDSLRRAIISATTRVPGFESGIVGDCRFCGCFQDCSPWRTSSGNAATKKNKAPEPCGPGAKFLGGVRHALFPGHTRLGALAFAGGVLPDATLRGMRRARSHGGTVLTVTGRALSSEASAPGSVAPCRGRLAGRGADTSAIPSSRVGTVAAGTAPAGGWPLARRYGSDLLPLRLPLLLQRGDVVFHAAPSRRFHGLCQIRSLPAAAPSFRARFASEAGFLAGWARRMTRLCSGARRSNQNPWGTASAHGSKRPVGLTRLVRGF